jgi:hypothetical protein
MGRAAIRDGWEAGRPWPSRRAGESVEREDVQSVHDPAAIELAVAHELGERAGQPQQAAQGAHALGLRAIGLDRLLDGLRHGDEAIAHLDLPLRAQLLPSELLEHPAVLRVEIPSQCLEVRLDGEQAGMAWPPSGCAIAP